MAIVLSVRETGPTVRSEPSEDVRDDDTDLLGWLSIWSSILPPVEFGALEAGLGAIWVCHGGAEDMVGGDMDRALAGGLLIR